jgi:hypothetical protein
MPVTFKEFIWFIHIQYTINIYEAPTPLYWTHITIIILSIIKTPFDCIVFLWGIRERVKLGVELGVELGANW